MANGDVPGSRAALTLRRLQWLMGLRVVVVTALLGATVVANLTGTTQTVFDPTQVFLYGLIVGTYAVTIVYALLLRFWSSLHVQTYLQVMGDVVICTAWIFVTGGIETIFLFVYSLTIINAAILLGRTGAVATAAVSWTAFGVLVAAQANGWLPMMPGQIGPNPRIPLKDIAFTLCMAFAGFHLVALLAGYLSNQLRTAAEALERERRALDAMKALYTSVVTSLNDALLIVTKGGVISFANQAFYRLSGMEEVETLGKPIADVLPGFDLVLLDERSHTVPGRVRRQEIHLRRAGLDHLVLDLSVSPYVDHLGVEAGSTVLINDQTQMREMEAIVKTSERLAALGEVAAGLAHEIRNPLASLSGSIELLRARADASGDPNGRRLMEIVLRETDRLNHLITDFLGFARPSAPHREAVEVDRLLEETLAVFGNDSAGEEQRVSKELKCGDVEASVDLGQIKQVLWNLLVNARQAMPGGGQITVRSYPEQINGHPEVVVEIDDEGPGISEGDLSRIFDPFFTTKSTGTGLGLATVHRIVEAHGGTVEVRNKPDKGAIFKLRLPAA